MTTDIDLNLLTQISASTISDAMDSLGLSGAVEGIHRRSTTVRIAGPVKTVKLTDEPTTDGAESHFGTMAIASASDGDVIVVEQRTGINAAGWGGLLASAAMQKGIRGVIIEGPARDIDEYDTMGFPVFSRSVTMLSAQGRVYEGGTDVPIMVGETKVNPGDYVVADASGVVFIASADIGNVLARALEISRQESVFAANIDSGRPIIEVLSADLTTDTRSGRPIIESGRPIIESGRPIIESADTEPEPTVVPQSSPD